MKKILFLLLLIFSMGIYSKSFSETDKKEVLKQFSELQSAFKKKNGNSLSAYVAYPLKDGNTKSVIWKNSSEFIKEFKDPESYVFFHIDELKVNPETGQIDNVEERLISKSPEGGDTFLDVTGQFLTPAADEAEFYYGTSGASKSDDLFVVTVSLYDDMVDGSSYYIFTLKDNKLKLISFLQLP
ncbi:hypothetical protein [Sebaldella sp. S0638]|uniref:hypothetical protein n=1 Tax=Sebaldella sp. S0638 TaxID=2957809 RepID=UPI0020A02D4D|nr:hypothetical protein [Sebaldella sp. S0638]MCP1223755.1 hypothetical protein [Sebaldella sp. S0638]